MAFRSAVNVQTDVVAHYLRRWAATMCSMMTRCRRDRKLAAITQVARIGLGEEGVFDPQVGGEGPANRRPAAFVDLLAARLAQAGRERISAHDHEVDDHGRYRRPWLAGRQRIALAEPVAHTGTFASVAAAGVF